MFGTGALEKRSMRQHIRGRHGLTEELLRREQVASFRGRCQGSS